MQEVTNPQQGNPALENAYKLAQSKGYKKDINSFKTLISSDEAALNNIYNEVKNKGYKKDINSFKELVGVTSLKKKDGTKPNSTSTSVSQKQDSVQKNGSSDAAKQSFRLPTEKEFEEGQKRGEFAPNRSMPKSKETQYDLEGNTGNVIPETKKTLPKLPTKEELKKEQAKGFYTKGEENIIRKEISKDFEEKGFTESPKQKLIDGNLITEEKRVFSKDKEKLKSDIDTQIAEEDLDNPVPFKFYSTYDKAPVYNPTTRTFTEVTKDPFVDSEFGDEKLKEIGIDPADFDGYLNEKGFKKDFLEKEEKGLFEGKGKNLSGADIQLAREIQKQKMFANYIAEKNERDFKVKNLNAKKENLDRSSTDAVKVARTTIFEPTKVETYLENEFPLLSKKLKERDEESRKILEQHNKGEAGVWYGTKNTLKSGWNGFIDRINNLSATVYDKIGMDETAEEVRMMHEQNQLLKPDTREVGYVSGKSVKYYGVEYLVDENGQIYDKDKKIRVTDLMLKPTYELIVKESKKGKEDWIFSPQGTSMQLGGVLGDMIVQVALTRGVGGAMASPGISQISNLSKLSKIPISKNISSAIIAQSSLGYSQGLEETMKAAKDAGLNDNEAEMLANDAAQRMAILYAVTAPISPQTKATEALFGNAEKDLIKKAILSYREVGKKGFVETLRNGIHKLAKAGTEISEEGLKELFQENIQQAGEVLLVNKETNKQAGKEILKDSISVDDFVNTSILSFASGGLITQMKLPTLFKNNNVEQLRTLNTLSQDYTKFEQNLDNLVQNGSVDSESAEKLKKDVKIFGNNKNKIPTDTKPEVALDLMRGLDEISQLEAKKKTLDASFHENIDEQIKSKREEIKSLYNQSKQDAVQQEATTTETKQEAQPQAEIQKTEQEVLESNNNKINEVNDNKVVEENVQVIPDSNQIKKPTIVVHGAVNGFGLQYAEGIDEKDVVAPKDGRGFLPQEQQKLLNEYKSVVEKDTILEDGSKSISIITPSADNFGRSATNTFEFVIPKGNKSTTEGIKSILDNITKSDLKGKEVINESVKQVKEYIDSNEATTTETKQEAQPQAEVQKTEQEVLNEEIKYKVPALLPKKFNPEGDNILMTESELELLDAKAEKIIENPREDVSDRIRIQQGNAFTIQDLDAIEQFFKARREGKETRSFSEWRKNTKNETAPSQVDNVDGNVQPGNNVVEPSGTTEQENNQAGDVQAADNGRNVEVKREIKIADKGQSYTVEKTDLGLVITDKKGKKPSKVTERKILDEYSKTINFTQGQRVDDSFESSEETYIDDIASKSQNASEIAEAIAYVEQADMNERKVDPNDLNATLPFLPQSWNMFIEAVKLAVKAGKTINDAIQEAIKKLKSEGIGNDEINAIVEKFTGQVTKKVESGTFKKKSGKSKSTTNESGQKPQAFTTRAFNAENISGRTRDKLDGLGLNYDVESQAKAQENAETIIAELGIIDAYNLAKEGKIRGGARTWIMAQMFEDLNNQINEASEKGETDLVEYLSDELSKIMKEFANEKTLTGQEIAMLNRIYNKFGMKYDLEFARENWKKRFGNEIPVEIEAKLKKAEAEIKEYEKQVKELEERIGTLEEQDAMDNLKDVVKRHNTNKPSPSSLKKAAEALRKAKFTKSLTDLSKLNSNPLLVVTGIFDGAIEIIATALDAGSTIEQAVKKGVEHIKSSDWYKGLSTSGKAQAEKIAKNDFKKFIKEQVSIPTSSVEVEEGAIKIPSDLIYSLVQSGIDNISDLTQAVHDAISEEYPNLTLREVRDAITGYGKQVAETKDDIKKEISRLKTDGKQMSALDDLAEGNRPKRSGRKAKEYTPEQRNRIKKIRELLKKLPIDDTVDKAKYYKNALEALKTRLENRIKDLNDAINKNERIVNERRNTILDDDAKELVKKRDEAQKEYDDYFGKPYKSDETLINEIVARKEKSLRELELKIESVKLEGKELSIKERRKVTDPKIDDLNKQIEDKRNELNDALEVVGIAESKRLDRAVKYSKRRLKELNEKIANGDFTRRKPKTYKYNRELIELKGKILIAKTKWDIEFEKQEFRKLGYSEKLLEYVYRLFGTVKGLKATFDLSAMLRQGVVLGSRNPKEYAKASVEMHKFAFDSKYYKDWMTELETSDDYIYMVEDGLSITDTSGDVLKSEERFVGNLLSTEVKVGGVNVNLVGRITDGSERAYGGFLNSLRVSVYRKIAKQYEVMGITRQEHPKKFKNIAKFVNNSTGRGVMTSDKRIAKALNIVFFSPRMITGMAGVVKDLVRSESTPYLRKHAATSLLSFMAYQFVMKMLIKQALILVGSLFDDDDDDEITMDMNPVSADFNKVRKGDRRYDVSSGYGIGVRTASRFILNETSKGIGEENKSFNDVYGKNRFNEVGSFFVNKLSPLSSQIYKYGIGEHPTEFKGKREDATAMDYTSALLIPISVTDLIENVQNDTPEGQMFLDLMLNTYGVSVQNYGDNKKSKNNKY